MLTLSIVGPKGFGGGWRDGGLFPLKVPRPRLEDWPTPRKAALPRPLTKDGETDSRPKDIEAEEDGIPYSEDETGILLVLMELFRFGFDDYATGHITHI